jgi:hypothetical protein
LKKINAEIVSVITAASAAQITILVFDILSRSLFRPFRATRFVIQPATQGVALMALPGF